jgi:hypothetical protein
MTSGIKESHPVQKTFREWLSEVEPYQPPRQKTGWWIKDVVDVQIYTELAQDGIFLPGVELPPNNLENND